MTMHGMMIMIMTMLLMMMATLHGMIMSKTKVETALNQTRLLILPSKSEPQLVIINHDDDLYQNYDDFDDNLIRILMIILMIWIKIMTILMIILIRILMMIVEHRRTIVLGQQS